MPWVQRTWYNVSGIPSFGDMTPRKFVALSEPPIKHPMRPRSIGDLVPVQVLSKISPQPKLEPLGQLDPQVKAAIAKRNREPVLESLPAELGKDKNILGKALRKSVGVNRFQTDDVFRQVVNTIAGSQPNVQPTVNPTLASFLTGNTNKKQKTSNSYVQPTVNPTLASFLTGNTNKKQKTSNSYIPGGLTWVLTATPDQLAESLFGNRQKSDINQVANDLADRLLSRLLGSFRTV